MTPVVAVIAPGAMGAAVGKRLADRGLKCSPRLPVAANQRVSAPTKPAWSQRATRRSRPLILSFDFAARRRPVAGIPLCAGADREQRQAGLCRLQCDQSGFARTRRSRDRPDRLASLSIAESSGRRQRGTDFSPRFYASGKAAPRFAALRQYGLDVRVLAGSLSAASALKMSYAGITKGTQAIGAAMMLAATRAGSAEALFEELSLQPEGDVGTVQAATADDAGEGLSMDRGNAGNRRLRRRRSRGARPL